MIHLIEWHQKTAEKPMRLLNTAQKKYEKQDMIAFDRQLQRW